MKNKQIFKYVNGQWTDRVESLLDNGWRVVAMHPVSTKDTYGCYVLLEKNEGPAVAGAPIEMYSEKEPTSDYGISMQEMIQACDSLGKAVAQWSQS